jgi:hypothetical protein
LDTDVRAGKIAFMKPALAPEDPINALFGCLKGLPRNPLAELEAEHRIEIGARSVPEPHIPLDTAPTPRAEDERLDAIYSLLGTSFEAGEGDVAARHDEHQP